jgi:DNA-directed RNA polymerase subunit RPC12/RpoP
MSEFKYACPVCGQHIKCDSSQSGTQMQCPTCFQKIVVPQAPSAEQKFILTGSKVGEERPLPKNPHEGTTMHAPTKSFSGIAVVIIIFLFIGVAVAFVYHGTIFKKPAPPDGTNQSPATVAQGPAAAPKPKPKKPAPQMPTPPSSDTNWSLNLKGWKIPEATAAGRVEGQDFVCQHAYFQNGYLNLRNGDWAVIISFSGATPEALAGKSLNVSTNAAAAARVSLRWKEGDQTMRESFTNDYAMLLNFNGIQNNYISGNIYLCTTDEKKSYVAGKFNAEIRKSKPRNQ